MAEQSPRRTARDSVRVTRFDCHLLAIPIGLVLSVVAHLVLGLPLRTTLPAGSLVGAAVIVDAVFRNPPTGRRGAV